MTTATKRQIKKQAIRDKRQAFASRIVRDLCERMDLSESKVDREACVIKGVKVLGRSSPNRHGLDVSGTDYTPEAHQNARPLYEGIGVYSGHPPRSDPDAERDPEKKIGTLFNVNVREGQTFADLQLVPSHPMAKVLMDCAENPRLHKMYALSHNAKGHGTVQEGRYRITEIPRVRSVDVVCDGGTNAGLFEGREPMKKPFKVNLQAAPEDVQKMFASLLEADEFYGDMPTDAPAKEGENDPGYEEHLAEMIKAIVMHEELTAEERLEKIKLALKIKDGEAKKEVEGEPKTTDVEEEEEEDAKKEDAMESRERQELSQLRAERKVRDLCESKEFAPTSLQLKALTGLSTDIDRKAMIDEFKKIVSPGKSKVVPVTGGARDVRESKNGNKGTKKEDFLAAITR